MSARFNSCLVKRFTGAIPFVLSIALSLFARLSNAQEIAISYPGLTGESASLWVARDAGHFKDNGIDAKLV